jgi:membrane-associated phospholipid phosphatase
MFRAVAVVALLVLSAPSAHAQSFSSLFTDLPADFRHLLTLDSAVILGTTGAAALPLRPNDNVIARHIRSDGDGFDEVLAKGGIVGDAGIQSAAALGIYIVGRTRHSEQVGRLGADLVRAQIVNGVITDGLKLVASRTRPDGRSYSFPSGHTSSAFATASVLQRHLGWKAAVPAYFMAAYVGSARMAEFRHFATDVVFGAGIGLTAGRAVTFNVARQRLEVTPALGPGTAGVNVSVK